MLHARLRRLLKPIAGTPFHPQWLVLRNNNAAKRTVAYWTQGVTLDIGCGDRWLSKIVSSACHYFGLDYPPTVAQGYPGSPDVYGDAANLPFRSSAINTVLLMDVLEHLRHPDVAIGEVVRVLKPGGYLILQVPFMYPVHDAPNDFQRWTREGLFQLLIRNGFRIVEETAYGNPIETAAALGAIALAKSGLNALTQHSISTLLTPLIVVLIPFINIAGWLTGKVFPADTFMPLGYRFVAEKPE